jgi:RNA polymerase sigma factor (sigma-70 family)
MGSLLRRSPTSSLLLRRYRAERLLRREYYLYRPRVLAAVRSRLRARKIVLDSSDLEECYTQAWHGLYITLLRGETVNNLIAWLTIVCFRRAIDEHRSQAREQLVPNASLDTASSHNEPDLAAALDDRTRLRHTFEAFRKDLNPRERQAATLCYLQGLTRAQAAAQMGIGEGRMQKLMDGRSASHPGVATKVDELVSTIRADRWCEQQSSLMRALAFGLLDPDGERYRLAELHMRECPACRAYVLSLRGLAIALPPFILPLAPFAAGAGGGTAVGGVLSGSGGAGSGGVLSGSGGASPSGMLGGSSAVGLGGAAGSAAGGVTGGWLPFGGSLAAKLATGCLLLAGVGGGCAALIATTRHHPHSTHRRHAPTLSSDTPPPAAGASAGAFLLGTSNYAHTGASGAHLPHTSSSRATRHRPHSSAATVALAAGGQAQRELGFERAPSPALPARGSPTAHQAQTRYRPLGRSSPSPPSSATVARSGSSPAAISEFEVR